MVNFLVALIQFSVVPVVCILTPKELRWLHAPKTGSSFINVLVTWACPDFLERSDISLIEAGLDGGWDHLRLRQHCFQGNHIYAAGHLPIELGVGWNNWNKHRGTFVGMFRPPEKRLLSNFLHNQQDVPGMQNMSFALYARSTAGCVVRLLNGEACRREATMGVPISESMVSAAVRRLHGFAFVGLTDEWELSVCLFHKMFGGNCHAREFRNLRPGSYPRQLTPRMSQAIDPFDSAVFARARAIFQANLAKHNVTPDSCREMNC